MLTVRVANDLEVLADDLARRLGGAPLPVDLDETILVPSDTVRRWLRLALAKRLGVAAGLDLVLPSEFARRLSEACGVNPTPAEDHFRREPLAWRILGLLEDLPADPVFAPLHGYLADGDAAKRFALADRIADGFDRMQQVRGDWLAEWEGSGATSKRTTDAGPVGDRRSQGISALAQDPHWAWQAALWRRLVEDLAEGDRHLGARLALTIARLRGVRAGAQGTPASHSPRIDHHSSFLPVVRCSAFALEELPTVYLDLLEALGRRIDVGVWLLSPVPDAAVWGVAMARPVQRTVTVADEPVTDQQMADDLDELGAGVLTEDELSEDERDTDDTSDERGHPLVQALGQQGLAWQRALAGREAIANSLDTLPWHCPAADSVLHAIQAALIASADGGADPALLRADDQSLRIHACAGPRRELEVLRESLVEAFATIDGLTPGDVVVLLPSVASYGALIPAVFDGPAAALADGRPVRLPWRIADRSLGEEDPCAAALVAFLRLAGSRWERSAVVDLLQGAPARAALGLDEDGLDRAVAWLDRAGLRWGRDGDHRRRVLGTAAADPISVDGTVAAVIDRLLMGLCTGPAARPGEAPAARPGTVSEDDLPRLRTVDGVVPVAGDLTGDSEALLRLCGWLDQALALAEACTTAQSVESWRTVLEAVLDRLLTAPADDDDGTGPDPAAARAVLGELVRLGAIANRTTVVEPAVVLAWLEGRLGGAGRTGDAVGGSITFCAAKPRRGIPARVIALLGLDDASHPRRSSTPAFDLVARDPRPRPGDRRPGAEDRQLFLDALLTARDRLHLSWTANDPASGTVREPSVCIEDLLRAAAGVFQTPATAVRAALVVRHRLTPLREDGPAWDPRLAALRQALAEPTSERPFVGQRTESGVQSPVVRCAHSSADQDSLTQTASNTASTDERAAGLRTPDSGPAVSWSLADLLRTLRNPSQAWLRAVAGIALTDDEDPADEREPFVLDGLQRHALREALVREALGSGPESPSSTRPAGAEQNQDTSHASHSSHLEPLHALLPVFAADGHVAPGALGRVQGHAEDREATALLDRLVPRPAGVQPVTVRGGSADTTWRIDASIPLDTTGAPLLWHPGALRVQHRLGLWLTALVWNAALDQQGEAGDSPRRTVRCVARDGQATLPAIRNAAPHLDRLVAVAERCRREPLPLFAHASLAAAEVMQSGGSAKSEDPVEDQALAQALKALSDEHGDLTDPAVALVLRGRDPAAVLADPEFLDLAGALWGWYLELEVAS